MLPPQLDWTDLVNSCHRFKQSAKMKNARAQIFILVN